MVCGTSGSGKSTLTTALARAALPTHGYQFAILDPEGDYTSLDFAVVLGRPHRAPLVEEVVDVLRDSTRNAVVNMLGVAVEHRPEFFAQAPARTRRAAHAHRPAALARRRRGASPVAGDVATGCGALVPPARHALRHRASRQRRASPCSRRSTRCSSSAITPTGRSKEFCKVAGLKKPPHVSAATSSPPVRPLYWETKTNKARVVETEPGRRPSACGTRASTSRATSASHSFFFRGPDEQAEPQGAQPACCSC